MKRVINNVFNNFRRASTTATKVKLFHPYLMTTVEVYESDIRRDKDGEVIWGTFNKFRPTGAPKLQSVEEFCNPEAQHELENRLTLPLSGAQVEQRLQDISILKNHRPFVAEAGRLVAEVIRKFPCEKLVVVFGDYDHGNPFPYYIVTDVVENSDLKIDRHFAESLDMMSDVRKTIQNVVSNKMPHQNAVTVIDSIANLAGTLQENNIAASELDEEATTQWGPVIGSRNVKWCKKISEKVAEGEVVTMMAGVAHIGEISKRFEPRSEGIDEMLRKTGAKVVVINLVVENQRMLSDAKSKELLAGFVPDDFEEIKVPQMLQRSDEEYSLIMPSCANSALMYKQHLALYLFRAEEKNSVEEKLADFCQKVEKLSAAGCFGRDGLNAEKAREQGLGEDCEYLQNLFTRAEQYKPYLRSVEIGRFGKALTTTQFNKEKSFHRIFGGAGGRDY